MSMLTLASGVVARYAEGSTAEATLAPYFFVKNGDPSVDHFPLRRTETTVTINGVIAEVVIRQTYGNDGSRPINATYVFPASTRAAVHGMTMTVGDHVIKAAIKERQEAKRVYETAKEAGKSASLLQQHRPNVFSMDVANIMPGDDIEVELAYTELLVPTGGEYSFVYPCVVGPRYSNQPESGAPATDTWVKNPYLRKGESPSTTWDITVDIATPIPLQELICRTHQTTTAWDGPAAARVTLDHIERDKPTSDFILTYRLEGKQIQSGLMLYEGERENFFLLMVEPPARVGPEHIPPREYVFVVDVSGSMNGFPLETAKKLLHDLIGNLRPTDLFNVILFSGTSSQMAPSSLCATRPNIDRALRHIDDQRGGGGTELLPAMQRVLSMPHYESRSRSIVVVSDGYIAAERELFRFVAGNRDRANVFAFGIGSSVNRCLIEGIARAGMGEPFVVTDPGQARGVAERFRLYIQSPVLTRAKLQANGFAVYDVQPGAIPDLLAQRPLVIFGKWRGEPRGTLTLDGVAGSGFYSRSFAVRDVKPRERHHVLRYLWARKRIEALSDHHFGTPTEDEIGEVTTLGLTYNLLTEYTSFVAVHETVRHTASPAIDVTQPLALPEGVSELAVGGVKAVPEPGLGLLAVLAVSGLLLFDTKRRTV
jgi:Ca-activated chloride channel family protein